MTSVTEPFRSEGRQWVQAQLNVVRVVDSAGESRKPTYGRIARAIHCGGNQPSALASSLSGAGMGKMARLPQLPRLLKSKIYKTGQTRGADDDVIFQNRVGRNSTVLIPFDHWERGSLPPPGEEQFENGFIALISPDAYFHLGPDALQATGLVLGSNALVFYERRRQWQEFNPERQGWVPANARTAPLGGQYVARIAATTAAEDGERINRGYTTPLMKGAGIRAYEYASSQTIEACRDQLEDIFWRCSDASDVVQAQGMSAADATHRRAAIAEKCRQSQLDDHDRLRTARILDDEGMAICPLCLERISASGFFSKVEQAEGRAVHDLTVTQLNLFHIKELRLGEYGHRPYNMGWGHHHCNIVVKDAGIDTTLIWMKGVVDRNEAAGYIT